MQPLLAGTAAAQCREAGRGAAGEAGWPYACYSVPCVSVVMLVTNCSHEPSTERMLTRSGRR